MIVKGKGFYSSLIIFFTLILRVNVVKAQDPQFTQFYAAPLYLNPAFAGATPCARVGLNYRNQWFLSRRPYTTYMLSGDVNLARYNVGVGGYIMYDTPGAGSYNTYEFASMVSYEVKLKNSLSLRFGLQPSYHLKYFNGGNFTYGDQITNLDGVVGGAGDPSRTAPSASFFDISSGAILYSDLFWVGLAAHHILHNPFTTDIKKSPVPMQMSVHGGMKIVLNKKDESYILPAFNIKNQGASIQSDIGLYYEKDKLILGAWYRGIPYLTGNGLNSDALAFLVGYHVNSMKFGYSYDLPLSHLINSYGTHELSAVFEFCIFSNKKPRPPKNVRQMPCPRM